MEDTARNKKPGPIDEHIGRQLRLIRIQRGLSQSELGERVGLTIQQIQRYEKGVNRIGASTLYKFSNTLKAPVSAFYDGLDLPED